MNGICTKCGLPTELCVCQNIAKESQRIVIKTVKQKFNKVYTVIEGIDAKDIDTKALAKNLKSLLACGGTAKGSRIELQGDHKAKVKDYLIQQGFAPETIDME